MPKDPKDPMHGNIRVTLFNADTDEHTSFDRLRAQHANHPWVSFVKRSAPDVVPQNQHAGGAVTPQVSRQTRDLVALLRAVASQSQYLLVMEDDFFLCPHALSQIPLILGKLHTHFPTFLSLKISYGFNGIVLKNGASGADVSFFASYLEEHQRRRPPDHLWTEFVAGETPQSKAYKDGRPHTAFRYNLLQHHGSVSVVRPGQSVGEFERCFAPLVFPTLFEVEAFKESECGHSDIQPCPPKPETLTPFVDERFHPPQ